MKDKTDLKCKGCKCSLPENDYDVKTGRSTFYARYRICEILEWICAECWGKGVRYTEGTVIYNKDMK